MNSVGFARRGTFHRASGPDHDPDRRHLHIICTDQDRFGVMLVVTLSSLKPYTNERTCLLGVGDHPYLTCRSFIDYRKARLFEQDLLREALKAGTIWPDDDLDAEHFDLVCRGLSSSRQVRPKIAEYYHSASPGNPAAA